MIRRTASFSLLAVAGLLGSAACSSTATDPPSVVSGGVSTSGFSAAPDRVVATDETGAQTSAALSADGTFQLSLPSNHVYSIDVGLGTTREHIGFPRADGRLDGNFRLGAGNATVDLGLIRQVTVSTKQVLGLPTVVCDGTTVSAACPNGDAPVVCPTHGHGHHVGGGDMSGGCPNMGSSTTPVVQTESNLDPSAIIALPTLNPPNDVTCP